MKDSMRSSSGGWIFSAPQSIAQHRIILIFWVKIKLLYSLWSYRWWINEDWYIIAARTWDCTHPLPGTNATTSLDCVKLSLCNISSSCNSHLFDSSVLLKKYLIIDVVRLFHLLLLCSSEDTNPSWSNGSRSQQRLIKKKISAKIHEIFFLNTLSARQHRIDRVKVFDWWLRSGKSCSSHQTHTTSCSAMSLIDLCVHKRVEHQSTLQIMFQDILFFDSLFLLDGRKVTSIIAAH